MDVKLSTENIRAIALFEKVTKVHAKDSITTDQSVYFLVDADKMGMAIGKNAVHIKDLRRITGKNVKIFGYSPDLEKFIRNIIPNVKTLEISGKHVSVTVSRDDKVSVIGKSGENINTIRDRS